MAKSWVFCNCRANSWIQIWISDGRDVFWTHGHFSKRPVQKPSCLYISGNHWKYLVCWEILGVCSRGLLELYWSWLTGGKVGGFQMICTIGFTLEILFGGLGGFEYIMFYIFTPIMTSICLSHGLKPPKFNSSPLKHSWDWKTPQKKQGGFKWKVPSGVLR